MTTVNPTISELPQPGIGRALLVTWAGMKNGDVGAFTSAWDYVDRTFQIAGTFGAGGTCVIEGSNDGTNFITLHDPFGNLLSFGSADLRELTEIPQYIRPNITGGDGTTAITVTAFMRKTRQQ